MAIRFRKSFTLFPGFRINFGKTGLTSFNLGLRGTSFTFAKNGVYSNVGFSGTGLSFRKKIIDYSSKNKERYIDNDEDVLDDEEELIYDEEELSLLTELNHKLSKTTLTLNDDGTINFLDSSGDPLTELEVYLFCETNKELVSSWLNDEKNKINEDIDILINIYKNIPDFNEKLIYIKEPFKKEPKAPIIPHKPLFFKPKPFGFFKSLFFYKNYLKKLNFAKKNYDFKLKSWEFNKDNSNLFYMKKLTIWKNEKKEFDNTEKFYQDNFEDLDFMSTFILKKFNSILWPKKVSIDFLIYKDGKEIFIDIHLPEINEFSNKVATLSANGKKLNIKKKTNKQFQLEYAKHIHGIAFLLTAYTFYYLPKIENLFISGYSNRLDKSLGIISKDCLFSYKIDKYNFKKINFDNLDLVDPILALDSFEHNKKMSVTGVFKSVLPLK